MVCRDKLQIECVESGIYYITGDAFPIQLLITKELDKEENRWLEIKDRKLADMTKRTVLSVLEGTYDKEKFVSRLREKGIDTVLRYTEEGRIYGATFIDHRTGCVLNGSRMGKELSANALQEHFTLPYAGQPPIPLSVPVETVEDMREQTASDHENTAGGIGLLTPEGPAVDAEEEAFIRAMQRKKKKKRAKGLREKCS